MSIFEQLRETIAQTLDVAPDSITQTSTAPDVPGWDSLGHVNLMMALEQTFDVQLEVEDFPRLTSVPAILDYLKHAGVS
jgi:acyl carrier protein